MPLPPSLSSSSIRSLSRRPGRRQVLDAMAPSVSAATRPLPLMSATLPGFDCTTWYAVYAPQATPSAVVGRLDATLIRVLQDPALEARIEPHGIEFQDSTHEEVLAWTRRDTDKWSRILREAKISID